MKVLIANWSWYPTGGDWTYIENVKRLYQEKGHQVIALSTQNSRNVETDIKDRYFIKSNDFKQLNKNKTIINGLKVVRDSVVSGDALKQVEQILNEHPDIKVAHLHNIHHYLTPAIVWKLKKKGIKIIWTLHDYKIICPENSFVSNGKVCEKCLTGNFSNCALNKCKKNSFLASSLAAIEAYFYHSTKTYDKVDAYLCPSEFLLEKFKAFGFDSSKLYLTNYCYDLDLIENFIANQQTSPAPVQPQDNYILYVGRVEEIKGVKTLIDAIRETGLKLKIAGSGTELDNLTAYVKSEGIQNIEFLGFQSKDAVFSLTVNAKFTVCPSEWYENFPFSITESFLLSKPVIGARMGGIPELVLDGKTGYLFEAGNVAELQKKLLKLWADDSQIKLMGAQAREHAIRVFNFETHWNKLNTVLNKLGINDN